ncbi:MAG TPA: sigma-54 dependent transcriptional regulator [Terriglobales bacterium]|nr:sigma-54 dependent transcriptional regulator [Terriglobales bacterium]
MPTGRILVVDDEASMREYLRTLLEVDGYTVDTAASGEEAIARVKQRPPDVILLDIVMPHMDGIQTLSQLRGQHPDLRVIILSCVSDTHKVVEAMRLGATDYITKPFQKSDFDATLERCFAGIARPLETGMADIERVDDDYFFVAASPAMHEIRHQAAQIARVDVPVLMLGESGTGKEVVARLIHKMSLRSHRAFLKVNCAAVPSDLLESELFGYEPGAFTGAVRAKPGKFELCNHGTMLLDEIAEMSPGLQAKLLHVLQDQSFSRLGGRTNVEVDVRVLAATNVNVQEALAEGRLREDLYYRLNAFTIVVPPLRERRQSVPALLKHFMTRMAEQYGRQPLGFSRTLLDACSRYAWPGNVRELENLVKRYLVLGDEAMILRELQGRAHTPVLSYGPAPASGGLKRMIRDLKDEAEAEAITRALQQSQGSRKEAARFLNISYKALLYKMRRYGIDAPLRGQHGPHPSAA